MKIFLYDIDDVGFDALAMPGIKMPTFNFIQSNSLSFVRNWAGPLCCQYRACLQTGQYISHARNLIGKCMGDREGQLPDYELTVGHWCLGSAVGVEAHHIGKWHLSSGYPHRYDHPNRCGYSHHDGTIGNIWPDWYGTWLRITDGQASQCNEYAPELFAEETINAIHANVPFVHFSMPLIHTPLHVPPQHLHSQGHPTSNEGKQMAMLEALDTLSSNLIFDALDQGYIVIVASDNTTTMQVGGMKGSHAELALRCPLYILGKNIHQGSSNILTQPVDLYATIVELFGGLLDTECHGISFAKELVGGSFKQRNFQVAEQWTGNAEAGTLPNLNKRRRCISDGHYKLHAHEDGTFSMFDIIKDINEDFNLLSSSSTSEIHNIYKDLSARLNFI